MESLVEPYVYSCRPTIVIDRRTAYQLMHIYGDRINNITPGSVLQWRLITVVGQHARHELGSEIYVFVI